ncbi:MAG: hypothetical protein ACLUAF_16340 [Paraclostridium sordellii]
MLKNLSCSKYLFFIGLIIFIISYIIPIDIFSRFTELKPLGLSTIFICPVVGIIGIIFSIKEKSILFGILNFLLVMSFPISMFIGNIIFK